MQINRVSSAAMAAAAAMLFTSGLAGCVGGCGHGHDALFGSEFLQGHLRVQVGQEQL